MLIFPFGELIVFTVILTSVNKLRKGKKDSLNSCIDRWYFPCYQSILVVITVGVDVFQYSNFPLLSAARLVSIGHFLERIDVIVVFIMTLGVITKSFCLYLLWVKGDGVYIPGYLIDILLYQFLCLYHASPF